MFERVRRPAVRTVDRHVTARSLFVLSAVVNALVVFYRGNFTDVRVWENGWIASNIVDGAGFASTYLTGTLAPTSVMAPVYPYLLAGVYTVFGQTPTAYLVVQLGQATVQAGAVVLVFCVARRLFDGRTAAVAGVGYALYPVSAYGTTIVHQLTLTTFGVVAVVLTFLRLADRGTLRAAAVCGVTLGVTALVFPTVLVTAPLLAGWLTLSRLDGDTPLRAVGLVAVVATVSLATVAPWTVRNYLVHGDFVLIKFTGWNFWRGNTPPAIYTGVPNELGQAPEAVVRRVQGGMSQAEAHDYLAGRAAAFVASHPVAFAVKVLENVFYFWWFPPVAESMSRQVPVVRRLVYAPLLAAGLLGMVWFRDRDGVGAVYAVAAGFSLGYGVFFVLPRYHVPTLVPFLFVFGTAALRHGVRRLRSRRDWGRPS